MKTKIFSLFATLALAAGLTSCHDDFRPGKTDGGEGQVQLCSLAVEIDNAEKVIRSSRASIDLSDFDITIRNAEDVLVKKWKYAEMPEVFTLPAGDYSVRVQSHEPAAAEWEHPCFIGEKAFTVVNDNLTPIGVVTCTLANIKVSVLYSDGLKKLMGDDVKVTVYVNNTGELEYTPAETRSGYFAALEGSSTLVAEFHGTVGGYEENLRYTATDVEAGQHRIITFRLKGEPVRPEETGSINVEGGINVDCSVTSVDLTANLSVEEDVLDSSDRPGQETPDPDDPDDPDNPDDPDTPSDAIRIYSDDVDFDNVNPISEHVLVGIDADNGVAHLQVTIKSDNANFVASVSELLPMSFDLAYPGENVAGFASMGFPVGDEVIGATHIDFDISQFVPLLAAFPGTHSFQISVTDQKSQQLVKTLTFKS